MKNKYTVAQALIKFLDKQYVERDGKKHKFFAGMWGIFGHGNVAGIGQALEQYPHFTYYQARNEQGMVHASAAYAKQKRRLSTFACTTSVGPGATNMITAAASATINRLPLLLLPGDTFVHRQGGPVLQELEHSESYSISVNDCFRPISRYWERIYRYEQLPHMMREAMRVLSSPIETGCVTLCFPEDVQTEAGFFDENLFEENIHVIPRYLPEKESLAHVMDKIQSCKRPLLIAGGGVLYSQAERELAEFCKQTKIPCVETQAGKGSLPYYHPSNLGAIGVTGTCCANRIAQQADLVVSVGTRLGDFTTASGTQFQNPSVKFVNINLNSRDAHKYNAFPVFADAKIALKELTERALDKKFQSSLFYQEDYSKEKESWYELRSSLFSNKEGISQASVLDILNRQLTEEDTLIGAAGSLPGDMHKLLDISKSSQYHMEYGYSCMGYEISGGLGVRFAKDKGEVFVLVGDGSYLMMHTELLTSLQEEKKLIIILIVNHKFACIDNLSKSTGSLGFGNEFRYRNSESQKLDGDFLRVDYAQNAKSLGVDSLSVKNIGEFEVALKRARSSKKSFLISVEVSESANVPAYETQWNVPVAEIAFSETVKKARKEYELRLGKLQ